MRLSLSLRSMTLVCCALAISSQASLLHAATYYWDGNDGTAGFGLASGTWAAPTAGTTTSGWSTSTTGVIAIDGNSVTTAIADAVNFGTASNGLGEGSISISGTVAANSLTFGAASGNITLSGGTIDVSRSANSDAPLTVNTALATISSNFIGTSFSSARGLAKSGTGVLVLSGDNSSYANSRTSINSGVLKIDTANALPLGLVTLSGGVLGLTTATGDFSRTVNYAPGNSAYVQFGSASGGGFAAYGGDRQVTLNGGGTVLFGVSNSGILGPLIFSHSTADSMVTLNAGINLNGGTGGVLTRTVQVNGGSASIDGTISGILSDTGTTKATFAKTGTGTLALTNTNTYSGATTVSAGTLLISGSGSINSSSGVTIADGAAFIYDSSVAFSPPLTLSANSTVGGTGTLAGDLTITSGSSFNVVNLLDPLVVGGTVSIYAGFGLTNLTGIDWGSIGDGTYTLIDGNLGPGVFDGLDNTPMDLGGGRTAFFQQGSLQLVVVPEPATVALVASGVALFGFRFARRRGGS